MSSLTSYNLNLKAGAGRLPCLAQLPGPIQTHAKTRTIPCIATAIRPSTYVNISYQQKHQTYQYISHRPVQIIADLLRVDLEEHRASDERCVVTTPRRGVMMSDDDDLCDGFDKSTCPAWVDLGRPELFPKMLTQFARFCQETWQTWQTWGLVPSPDSPVERGS